MDQYARAGKIRAIAWSGSTRLMIIALTAAIATAIAGPRDRVAAVQVRQEGRRTALRADPVTGIATLELSIEDARGRPIPNIRRQNIAVFENGVRQRILAVNVDHAHVSVGLLLEHGGRHPALNRELTDEVSYTAHDLLNSLGRDDAAALWTYAGSVKELAPFTPASESLASAVVSLERPPVSETNLYDALIAATRWMRPVSGRKAIVLISSGIDTFSSATYEDALAAARRSDAPIYSIWLGRMLEEAASVLGMSSTGIDWKQAGERLGEIALVSGGRLYAPENGLDSDVICDDLVANLAVRYLISWRTSSAGNPDAPRSVRVELVSDESGRSVRPKVVAQLTYSPAVAEASEP